VKEEELEVTESAVRGIIRYYTREAGVRSLEREISKICRKVVKGISLRKYDGRVSVTEENLNDFLGVRRYNYGMAEKENQVGQVVGLAWTEVGGDLLTIESAVMPGKGNIIRTGSLGDVMKESARAALSWTRAHAKELDIDPDFYKSAEIHLHVPSGAIPKDGPSAGVTMTTALVSELTGRPVRGDLAMTGEITLSGKVLPVGGIKEKVLAARRVGIREVILPRQNEKNVNEDLSPELRADLTIHLVSTIDEVLDLALTAKSHTDRSASLPTSVSPVPA
jgi:ATP-dependent Lon protease